MTFEGMVSKYTPSEVEDALTANDSIMEIAYAAMVKAMRDESLTGMGTPEELKAEFVVVQEVVAYLQGLHDMAFHARIRESVEQLEGEGE